MRDSVMILLVSTNHLDMVKQTHALTRRRVFNDYLFRLVRLRSCVSSTIFSMVGP